MPAGERRAAQTLIANYPLIGLKTVADFSQQAGVSSPTILRFVARLGFQNYPEFQSTLQDELAEQLQSPLNRAENPSLTAAGEDSPTVSAVVENIRETFRHLSKKQITQLATLLADHKSKTFLVGGRFTDPIARYLAAHLTIIRPNVFHLAGQESNWRDRLIDMGKRDVLLIFDIRRYQESLIRFAEKAHQRGVQIVLFTDQWLSPIARFARHVIAGRTAVPSAMGFVRRAVRGRRDADRRAHATARKGQRAAHPRDGEPALARASPCDVRRAAGQGQIEAGS